jgi:hypothetical protein
MDRDALLSVVRTEFLKHRWDSFIDNPLSVAQGGGDGWLRFYGVLTPPPRRDEYHRPRPGANAKGRLLPTAFPRYEPLRVPRTIRRGLLPALVFGADSIEFPVPELSTHS